MEKNSEEIQGIINEMGYIQSSGKMVLLDKLLPKLRTEGHKVLIFSQMVKMLDLLSEYCDLRGFNHERLDGRVRGNERQKAIDRFETEEDSFIFMLSTRAGGVGINLTAADICIIFDSDWNPQNDVQAQARCHRIGQTKNVMIYRLITSRSFEQEMFDRASKKLGLEQAVLGTFDNDDDGKPTAKEMEKLLKKGAYALLGDENDEITNSFCTDDIESILAKRTRTRVVEGAKTASWLNKQGMVSRVKYPTDSADLDMDDPDFWQKVMPDFVTPSLMLNKLEELESQTTESSEGSLRGRGRGRKKKLKEDEGNGNADIRRNADNENKGSKNEINRGSKKKVDFHITRTSKKKISQFIQDLNSMMEDIFHDMDEDKLADEDKANCQKLLLNVSCKEKLFTDEQRLVAKNLLKRVEGDRRRRCRDTGDEPARFISRSFTREPVAATVDERLMIRNNKKRRKKRMKEDKDEEMFETKRQKKASSEKIQIVEDSYLNHSDSEEDWSETEDKVYKSKKKNGISKKEAQRRRAWASDKDAAKRPWPSFPRTKVFDVLKTLLDNVKMDDKNKGGLFCVPVARDLYPEYYEMIKNPMDYGTMQEKLDRGEYRSAQAMQKDFVLIMSNCLQFNSANSSIVKEAKQQTLMRPKLLQKAAMEHNLFLAEDGSVIDVYSDHEQDDEDEERKDIGKEKPEGKKSGKKKSLKIKVKAKKKKVVRCNKCVPCRREDCGECKSCQDKKKFGGSGVLKQPCIHRKCENLNKVCLKAKRGRPRKKKLTSDIDTVDSDNGEKSPAVTPKASPLDGEENGNHIGSPSDEKKKPRLRIIIPRSSCSKAAKQKDLLGRIPKKRRKAEMDVSVGDDNSLSDGEIEEVPKERKKRKKRESTSEKVEAVQSLKKIEGCRGTKDIVDVKRKTIKPFTSEKSGVSSNNHPHTTSDHDSALIYMNLEAIRNERVNFDGSLLSARSKFISLGPWSLPEAVGEDKFKEVAKVTIDKICRYDQYDLFAEEVSESEAPGYFDLVKKPMDFGTMKAKLENEKYAAGSQGMMEIYNDFLLVMDNCALYNENNEEVLNEAGRLLSLLPEIFAVACVAAAGKTKRRLPKSRK